MAVAWNKNDGAGLKSFALCVVESQPDGSRPGLLRMGSNIYPDSPSQEVSIGFDVAPWQNSRDCPFTSSDRIIQIRRVSQPDTYTLRRLTRSHSPFIGQKRMRRVTRTQ